MAMNIDDWAKAERQSIAAGGLFPNAHNEFRARLRKSGQHISTQETSALWKRAAPIPPATGATASDSIAAVVEVAPQAAEVSEEERADEETEEEETEAQE